MSIVNIDDTDPSIVWTGDWKHSWSTQSPAYNHTSSGSKTAGATALVTFTGTSITVFGTLTHGINTSTLPLSLYALDDGPVSGSFAPSRPVENLYHQKFFGSPLLPYGKHQLKIIDETTTDTGLWLDLFVVTTGPETSSITASPAQSIIPQSTESVGSAPKVHPNSWIIAVSVVVGCVVLAAILLIVYFARRRRLKQNKTQVIQTAEPFLLQLPPQYNVLSLESPYRLSGMHSKAGLNASSSVQRSYDLSRSDGSGSQIDDFAAQPPMYTERITP